MITTDRWTLAVDGGGSKTDAVAIAPSGEVLAHVRGGGFSPQLIGVEASVHGIDALLNQLLDTVDADTLQHAGLYLSGLDFPEEIATYRRVAGHRWWLPVGSVLDNDLFALLRSGTTAPDAAVIVVGTGINALAVRADGAVARYAALGTISGDWGGGSSLGSAALWHAARSEDGRGAKTLLQQSVPEFLGVPDVAAVSQGLHFGRLDHRKLPRLAELVFAAARKNDPVALDLVNRQADEIVVMVTRLLVQLALTAEPVPVVMGGGVIAGGDHRLLARVFAGFAEAAPLAGPAVVQSRPVLGASLLSLQDAGWFDRLDEVRLRLDLEAELARRERAFLLI